MWIPRDVGEIEEAARTGRLEETPSLDAKRELPATPKKNADVAVDVAAMSTDGGVLLYGIAEDEHGRPTIPQPIPLAGAADRIGQIVASSISEAPCIDVREYACLDDSSIGYLLVIVPQSARAPHQVTVGGDLRFYGRGAKGNRRLTEGEVARLYQRRQEWDQDRDVLLTQTVAAAPCTLSDHHVYLHGFARPVAPDRAIWERAIAALGGRDALLRALSDTAPSTRRTSLVHWRRRGADAWRLSSLAEEPDEARLIPALCNITVSVDGRADLFNGGGGQSINRNGPTEGDDGYLVIYELDIAATFAAFIRLLGALYDAAGYVGQVDLGLMVRGLAGARSMVGLDQTFWYVQLADRGGFSASEYPRTERVPATELQTPAVITRDLLRPLFEATTGRDDFDPFAS